MHGAVDRRDGKLVTGAYQVDVLFQRRIRPLHRFRAQTKSLCNAENRVARLHDVVLNRLLGILVHDGERNRGTLQRLMARQRRSGGSVCERGNS